MSELNAANISTGTVCVNSRACVADRIREATNAVIAIRRKGADIVSDMFGAVRPDDVEKEQDVHSINELLDTLMHEIERADMCIASIKAHI